MQLLHRHLKLETAVALLLRFGLAFEAPTFPDLTRVSQTKAEIYLNKLSSTGFAPMPTFQDAFKVSTKVIECGNVE